MKTTIYLSCLVELRACSSSRPSLSLRGVMPLAPSPLAGVPPEEPSGRAGDGAGHAVFRWRGCG